MTSDLSALGFEDNTTIDLLLNSIAKSEMKGQKIKYDVCINVSKYAKLKEISFEDIDSYDFEHKGFVEFLFSDSLVHQIKRSVW